MAEGRKERTNERERGCFLTQLLLLSRMSGRRHERRGIGYTSPKRCMLFEFREVRRRAIRYRGENHAAKALTSLEMLCVPSRLEVNQGKKTVRILQ